MTVGTTATAGTASTGKTKDAQHKKVDYVEQLKAKAKDLQETVNKDSVFTTARKAWANIAAGNHFAEWDAMFPAVFEMQQAAASLAGGPKGGDYAKAFSQIKKKQGLDVPDAQVTALLWLHSTDGDPPNRLETLRAILKHNENSARAILSKPTSCRKAVERKWKEANQSERKPQDQPENEDNDKSKGKIERKGRDKNKGAQPAQPPAAITDNQQGDGNDFSHSSVEKPAQTPTTPDADLPQDQEKLKAAMEGYADLEKWARLSQEDQMRKLSVLIKCLGLRARLLAD